MPSAKANLRAQVLAERTALADELIARSSKAMCAIMQAQWHQLFGKFQQAFLFYPLPKEPDLRVLAMFLRTQGVVTALPVVSTTDMVFKTWVAEDELRHGKFNLKEPTQASICKANAQTIIFVPCLALDVHGVRLGYGRGYYDRFLATNKATTVGVCMHRFLRQSLPHEKHDQAVDYLLTDKNILPMLFVSAKQT